jgi:hypothetical protein
MCLLPNVNATLAPGSGIVGGVEMLNVVCWYHPINHHRCHGVRRKGW